MADDKSTYSTAEPLTAQNVQEAIDRMRSMLADGGVPYKIEPTHIMVHPRVARDMEIANEQWRRDDVRRAEMKAEEDLLRARWAAGWSSPNAGRAQARMRNAEASLQRQSDRDLHRAIVMDRACEAARNAMRPYFAAEPFFTTEHPSQSVTVTAQVGVVRSEMVGQGEAYMVSGRQQISLKLELGPSLPFPMTWEACDQLVSEMLTAPPGAAPGERLNGYGEPVAPPDLWKDFDGMLQRAWDKIVVDIGIPPESLGTPERSGAKATAEVHEAIHRRQLGWDLDGPPRRVRELPVMPAPVDALEVSDARLQAERTSLENATRMTLADPNGGYVHFETGHGPFTGPGEKRRWDDRTVRLLLSNIQGRPVLIDGAYLVQSLPDVTPGLDYAYAAAGKEGA